MKKRKRSLREIKKLIKNHLDKITPEAIKIVEEFQANANKTSKHYCRAKTNEGLMNDLERIIGKAWDDNKHISSTTKLLSCFAQAIIDAGYVKREEIEIDKDKLHEMLNEWNDMGVLQYTGNIAHAISQSIQSLIVRKV